MKDLILLHGALSSQSLFQPLIDKLTDDYEVHSFNLSGHGKAPFNPQGFGMDVFTEELLAFIQAKQLEKPLILGYSMGGYVALCLEARQPCTFEKIFTLGTKFGWNPEAARQEASRLKPQIIEQKVPAFANMLAERHGQQWKDLLDATAQMMINLGDKPLLESATLTKVAIPVIIMRGNQDQMVSQEESKTAVSYMPEATYVELHNTPHPIEKVNFDLLANQLRP